MTPIQKQYLQASSVSTLFMGAAFLASSKRFVQYFPGVSKQGLVCSALLGSGALMGISWKFPKEEQLQDRCIWTTAALALNIFATPIIAQKLTGRASLGYIAAARFAAIQALIFGSVEVVTYLYMRAPSISKEPIKVKEVPKPALLDPKTVDFGPHSSKLQGTENTFRGWCQVDRAEQPKVQDKLKELAVGHKRKPCIGCWDDTKVKTVLEKGFNLGSFHWQLKGEMLTAASKEKNYSFDLGEVRVAHTDTITPKQVNAYLRLEDISYRRKERRENKGYNIAIRGPIAHQYQIVDGVKSCQIKELTELSIQQMIWACWPNVRRNKTATEKDLADYQQSVLKTLNLLRDLSDPTEIISIVVPRAFIPQKVDAKDTIENKKDYPLYYAYRKTFIQTVYNFSKGSKQPFLLHAIQKNELDVIKALKLTEQGYLTVAPLGSDSDVTGVKLSDQGYKVVHMCTGDPVGHIGNAAAINGGGWAKDERDVRLAMVTYLAIFSGIVNPSLSV